MGNKLGRKRTGKLGKRSAVDSDVSRSSNSTTLPTEEMLPKLQVPDLNETCNKFLKFVKPLLDEADYNVTKLSVEQFRKTDGPLLQQKLLDFDESLGRNGNYVDDAWTEAYLVPDDPITINVNPYFVLEKGPDPATCGSQTERAADLLESALRFVLSVRTGNMAQDRAGKEALDMSQYASLFNSARIPDPRSAPERSDRFKTFSFATEARPTRHVAILCRGQLYTFNVFTADGLSIGITRKDIIANFNGILLHAQDGDASRPSIASCTSFQRSEWGSIRKALENHSAKNRNALDLVDSSVLVLSLDTSSPSNDNATVKEAICGGDKTWLNRWYDKLQLIVCENGEAMVNFEHSAVDGHTVLRFAADLSADAVVRYAQKLAGSGSAQSRLKSYRIAVPKSTSENEYAVTSLRVEASPEIEQRIREGNEKAQAAIAMVDCGALSFVKFGKSKIKSWSLSPDAFVQLAMLTAYHRVATNLHVLAPGTLPSSYESVMTKQFFKGRTEAGRTSSEEAQKFIQSLQEDCEESKLYELLSLATKTHSAMTKECGLGKGVDRHLFALRHVCENSDDLPLPSLFRSPGYHTLTTTILSTSNCGNPSLKYFGFGPVSEQGVGIGYIIRDDRLQFTFSSKVIKSAEYLDVLQETLQDFRKICKSAKKSRRSSKSSSRKSLSHKERLRVKSLVM